MTLMPFKVNACKTAWGWVGIVSSSQGLLGTTLPQATREQVLASLLDRWPSAQEGLSPVIASLQEKLRHYFAGEPVDFRGVVLDPGQATAFQLAVWAVVRGIPRGQVQSYAWVAAQAGSPRAARAVGQAMARNPFPIVVPCHRVVGRDGGLTGFGGGLNMKRDLLRLEVGPAGDPAGLTS